MHRFTKLLAAAAFMGCTTLASAAGYSGVYIFGDSLSDTGNDALLVGSDPALVVSGNTYIPIQPYASGQFTNGDVWVKPFMAALGQSTFGMPSLAGGGNFAFGGARTATDGNGQPPSIFAQTGQFLDRVAGDAPSQALYVIEAGGNDARDALTAAASSATPAVAIASAATAYAQAIGQAVDRLQAAGAKNIVVWDVPNLALAPAVTAQGAGASFLGGLVSSAMNSALSARLSIEADVSIFDIYGLQNAITADPLAYGLTNVTDACGAVSNCIASDYFYWDGIHPTEAVHSLIAQNMLSTLVPEPATWALFAGGLLLIGQRARQRREG